MPASAPVVFLLDVDNTLLDNDQVISDLRHYLADEFGTGSQARYWTIFETLRAELGYADYLGAIQRYRAEHPSDPHFAKVSFYLLGYPFHARLFPDALAVIQRLRSWGPTAILTDGDVVFQPWKLKQSGLYDAVGGQALITIHKERQLRDVELRYPADHYVLVDDKLRILAALKEAWGTRVTTVFPRQGHYAHDPKVLAAYPPADITIERLGELLTYDLPNLLAAGPSGAKGTNTVPPTQRLDMRPVQPARHVKILVIDIGGTHVKVLATGRSPHRLFPSGPGLTPEKMVRKVLSATADWNYDVISMGYPGLVLHGKIVAEPHHLGPGWVGFDFQGAFGRPVKIVNDAAMQALGSYDGGRMLFLGLGTGLGSAMIVDGIVEPMELGHLPYRKGTFEDYVGLRGLKRLGKRKWRHYVEDVVARLTAALEPEYVVLGGGNVKQLKVLPPHCRTGDNANAFTGGFRLWERSDHDGAVGPARPAAVATTGADRTDREESSPPRTTQESIGQEMPTGSTRP